MARVLVVDDDPLIRWSLQSVLCSEGHDVNAVDSAENALAEVEMRSPNVAIVDFVLPGMNGLELIERMRSVCPAVKVIVITGQGSPELVERTVERDVFAYVEKPFSIKELTGLVWMALRSQGKAQGQEAMQ